MASHVTSVDRVFMLAIIYLSPQLYFLLYGLVGIGMYVTTTYKFSLVGIFSFTSVHRVW